jgi:hypothetical protein
MFIRQHGPCAICQQQTVIETLRLDRRPRILSVMPALVAGIHVFAASQRVEDVDGRDTSSFTRVFDALCPAMTAQTWLDLSGTRVSCGLSRLRPRGRWLVTPPPPQPTNQGHVAPRESRAAHELSDIAPSRSHRA